MNVFRFRCRAALCSPAIAFFLSLGVAGTSLGANSAAFAQSSNGSQIKQAAEWHSILSKDREEWFMDAQSIKAEGNIVSFWIKVKNKPPYPLMHSRPIGWSVSKWAIDCGNRTSSIGQTIIYSVDGSLIDSTRDPTSFSEAAPDSNADYLVRSACDRSR